MSVGILRLALALVLSSLLPFSFADCGALQAQITAQCSQSAAVVTLADANCVLSFSNCESESLTFVNLADVDTILVSNNEHLVYVSLPKLAEAGNITITLNPVLASITLPKLTSVSAELSITENGAESESSFSDLILDQLTEAENIIIDSNGDGPNLVDLSALDTSSTIYVGLPCGATQDEDVFSCAVNADANDFCSAGVCSCNVEQRPCAPGKFRANCGCGVCLAACVTCDSATTCLTCPANAVLNNQGLCVCATGYDDTDAGDALNCQDITPPELTCPGNLSQHNDNGKTGANVTFNAQVTDSVGPVGLAYVSGPTTGLGNGSHFPAGTTWVTVTAKDGANNAVNCTFFITVFDGDACEGFPCLGTGPTICTDKPAPANYDATGRTCACAPGFVGVGDISCEDRVDKGHALVTFLLSTPYSQAKDDDTLEDALLDALVADTGALRSQFRVTILKEKDATGIPRTLVSVDVGPSSEAGNLPPEAVVSTIIAKVDAEDSELKAAGAVASTATPFYPRDFDEDSGGLSDGAIAGIIILLSVAVAASVVLIAWGVKNRSIAQGQQAAIELDNVESPKKEPIASPSVHDEAIVVKEDEADSPAKEEAKESEKEKEQEKEQEKETSD